MRRLPATLLLLACSLRRRWRRVRRSRSRPNACTEPRRAPLAETTEREFEGSNCLDNPLSAKGCAHDARWQRSDLTSQFQDIAVQLQGGASPFTIALQQGTQINQVFGRAGAGGVVSLLGTAFASLLTPVQRRQRGFERCVDWLARK